MELSIGEMLLVAVTIVVMFGPDKLPKIARDLGAGVRKMKGAMDDVKSEILKETDDPVSEIKKEIEKVRQAAQDYNPMANVEKEVVPEVKIPEVSLAENDQHEGPVSR